MSEENVELVSRVYADFGLSPRLVEAAAQAGLIAPDAEFDYSALLPDGPVVRGVEAWGEHADSSPWGGSLKLASERIFDVDDERVLVFVHSSARGGGERGCGRGAHRNRVHDPRRGHRAHQALQGSDRGPESRRAVGVAVRARSVLGAGSYSSATMSLRRSAARSSVGKTGRSLGKE